MFRFVTAILCLSVAGCSTLQVRVIRPKSPPTRVVEASAQAAVVLERGVAKGVAADRVSYNEAVSDVLRRLVASHFSAPRGVAVRTSGPDILDPAEASAIYIASDVRIRGLISRASTLGVGVPVALWVRPDAPSLAGQPGIPRVGMVRPGTAVIVKHNGRPTLEIFDTLATDRAVIGGRRVKLATDFSAPIAILLTRGRNQSLDLWSMLFSNKSFSQAGLYQLQPYDPAKIPVIFVHGLMSSPQTWTRATNELLADPLIRKRYQFWYFRYPTGLPVWASAALLRTEMDRFREKLDPKGRNPNLNQIVVVGHSMGGLVTSLIIREAGEKLWGQFSDKRVEDLGVSDQAKARIRELIFFKPRRDIARVVFMSTPHRGSPFALRPISNFGASLIQTPVEVMHRDQRDRVLAGLKSSVRSLFVAPLNSIRFLRAESPLLLSILKLPVVRPVSFHSVMGDRGKGDTPHSTDGVVPYWSSHLDGVVSEKIVPSDHGSNENAEGIAELRRILRESN